MKGSGPTDGGIFMERAEVGVKVGCCTTTAR